MLAGIAVAEEGIGKAIENIETYASVCGMRWIGFVTALAKMKRQVAGDKTVEPLLEQLAEKPPLAGKCQRTPSICRTNDSAVAVRQPHSGRI